MVLSPYGVLGVGCGIGRVWNIPMFRSTGERRPRGRSVVIRNLQMSHITGEDAVHASDGLLRSGPPVTWNFEMFH